MMTVALPAAQQFFSRARAVLRRLIAPRVQPCGTINVRALDALPLGVFVADVHQDGQPVVYVNAAYERLSGQRAAELLGRSSGLLYDQDFARPAFAHVRAGLEQGRSTVLMLRKQGPEGNLRWIELTLAPMCDDARRLSHVVGLHNDVSTREQARTAMEAHQYLLLRQTEMLNQTQSVARVGGWELDVATLALLWTRETYLLLDSRPGDYQPTLPAAMQAFLPESRARLEPAMQRAMREGIAFDLELELLTLKKRRLWIRLSGQAERRGHALVRLYGAMQDIDERKRAEGLIAEQREWLGLYFDLPMVGMARTAADGSWLEVNRTLCEMLAYGDAELQGLTWLDLVHPGERDACREAFRDTQGGGSDGFAVDRRFLRRDGSIVHTHLTLRCVRHEDGLPAYYLVMLQDIGERIAHQAQIARLAYYDELTGLPNRRMLLDRLERELARSQRQNYLSALLFLDLDHFKHVNDSLGHPVGDALLREVARRLGREIREEDTLARLGGDEFVLLLVRLGEEEGTAARNATRVARKLIDAIRAPMMVQAHELNISTSVGIALFPNEDSADPLLKPELDASIVLKQADVALYRAKEGGRNDFVFFSASMQEAANQRLKLQSELLRAVDRGELELQLQAQIALDSGDLFGGEVLLRWHSREFGLIPPAVFIPLAEDMGLISALGDWVLEHTVRLIHDWRPHFEAGTLHHLAVNLSARQLRVPDFVPRLVALARAHDIEARWLQLEITESVMLQDPGLGMAAIEALQQAGFSFSLDDFGTGYSSLVHLKRLPLQTVKIDSSYVQDLADEQAAMLVDTMIVTARRLGLRVIAEGVETASQSSFLLRHGCHGAQGYLFARPQPVAAFAQRLARS